MDELEESKGYRVAMNKFSNINWAAFLLGGFWWPLWNKFYGWAAISFTATLFLSVAGLRLGVVGPALSFTIQQFMMSFIAIYFALQGNRMLSDRIQAFELEPGEERATRDWTYKRQRRQTALGIFLLIFLCVISLLVIPYLFYGSITFANLLISITVQVAPFAILLILAPQYYPGKNELLADSEDVPLQKQEDQAAKKSFPTPSRTVLSALIILVLFGLLILVQEGMFAPERQATVENSPEVLEVIAGEYREVGVYSGDGSLGRRIGGYDEIYTFNRDSTFSFQFLSGNISEGVFSVERVAFSDAESIVGDFEDPFTQSRFMQSIAGQINAGWYHINLFNDMGPRFDDEILMSIVDEEIFVYWIDSGVIYAVERLR